jgi:hypothetical protein
MASFQSFLHLQWLLGQLRGTPKPPTIASITGIQYYFNQSSILRLTRCAARPLLPPIVAALMISSRCCSSSRQHYSTGTFEYGASYYLERALQFCVCHLLNNRTFIPCVVLSHPPTCPPPPTPTIGAVTRRLPLHPAVACLH